jgi:allantoin racemase
VLLASQQVSDVDGVPVLDALSAWVKQAEMLVDLRQQNGIRGSTRGYFHEPPNRERLKEIASFYNLHKFRHGE